MNKQNLIIIILSLIILTGVGFFGYNYISSINYQEGFNDASIYLNNQIINSLNQNGYITIYYINQNNQTEGIKLIPYIENEG